VRVTVVGCAGSFPNAESPASCYLIEHDGTRVVLDMGNGSLGALANHVDLTTVDAVLLSHLHLDHCADLGSYYVVRKYHPSAPLPRLAVFGPASAAARMLALYADASAESFGEVFDFQAFASESFTVGALTIEVALMVHPVEAYAIKVQADGKSVVYSGDTGPNEVLWKFARGVDLALFEASFLTDEVAHVAVEAAQIHMTAAQAAELAAEADVQRLVLTHLVAWNDRAETLEEARQYFAGPMSLATSGMVIGL